MRVTKEMMESLTLGSNPLPFKCRTVKEYNRVLRNAYAVKANNPRADGCTYKIVQDIATQTIPISVVFPAAEA